MRAWDRVFADSLISKERTKFRRCAKDFHSLNPRGKSGEPPGESTRGGGGRGGKKCTCCRFTPMHNKAACYRAKSPGSSDGSSRSCTFVFGELFCSGGGRTGRRNNLPFLCAASRRPVCSARHSFRYLHDKKSWNYSAHGSIISWQTRAKNRDETTVFPGSFSIPSIQPDPADPFCSTRVFAKTRSEFSNLAIFR